jgi:hypothetical protein
VPRPGDVRVADRVQDQPGEVDLGALQRPSGVQAGEQQQVPTSALIRSACEEIRVSACAVPGGTGSRSRRDSSA